MISLLCEKFCTIINVDHKGIMHFGEFLLARDVLLVNGIQELLFFDRPELRFLPTQLVKVVFSRRARPNFGGIQNEISSSRFIYPGSVLWIFQSRPRSWR
jgi:hypothetical protein